MELRRALDQISEIHGQLAKSEMYRSYKAFPVAVSGLLALAIAALQPDWIAPDDGVRFVVLWTSVAGVSLAMSAAVILYNYFFREGPVARRTTRRVVGQFVPSVLAGALLTAAITWNEPKLVRILPGCWALLFGLGLFAARPYLPRAVGWVALFYLAAGTILLGVAPGGASLSPWGMGSAFGAGQLLAAGVLHWNLERSDHA